MEVYVVQTSHGNWVSELLEEVTNKLHIDGK